MALKPLRVGGTPLKRETPRDAGEGRSQRTASVQWCFGARLRPSQVGYLRSELEYEMAKKKLRKHCDLAWFF